MAATFVIFLREGIEASMVIAILLSYLNRIGQRRHFRDVFLGVGASLVLCLATGIAVFLTVRTYAGTRAQTIFETVTYLVAAAVLTYMTFWMRTHGRTLSSELRERTEVALGRGARASLSLMAFQAVGREGLETTVFTLAIVFAATTHGVIIGGVAGLAVSLVVAFAIYRLGHRLNLARFFTVVGGLLIIFAAGILADAVENLQSLGWLPFLTHSLWNTSGVLSENSAAGDVFHSFFGYSSQPTVLQAIVYLGYLAVVLTAFYRLGRRPATIRQVPAPPEVASAESA
jgi:high-affinity iron transporter